MPLLLVDFIYTRGCKPFCEKYLTLPTVIHDFNVPTAKITTLAQSSPE